MIRLKYELIHLREKCEASGSSAHLTDAQFFRKTKLLKEEILQQQHIATDFYRILDGQRRQREAELAKQRNVVENEFELEKRRIKQEIDKKQEAEESLKFTLREVRAIEEKERVRELTLKD